MAGNTENNDPYNVELEDTESTSVDTSIITTPVWVIIRM